MENLYRKQAFEKVAQMVNLKNTLTIADTTKYWRPNINKTNDMSI